MTISAAVADLLGVPPESLTWSALPPQEGERFRPLLLEVGALRLELRDAAATPTPWVRGRWAGLAYRQERGDPMQDAVLRRELLALALRFRKRQTAARIHRLVEAVAELPPPVVPEEPSARKLRVLQEHFGRDGHDIYSHPEGRSSYMLATLRLGFRCNQRCGLCWQGRTWPDAPEDRWRRDLDRLADSGVGRVTITGGEPTVYRHLPAVIAHASGLGMAVHLQTNAIRLGQVPYLRRLVDAGLGSVFVSLHAADADLSDAMTGAPGTWARTCRGIEAALELGLEVRLNCVVEASNVEQLPAHAALIAERFAGVSGVSFSHPTSSFVEARYEETLAPLDAVRAPLRSACDTLRRAGIPVDVLGTCGFPPCLFDEDPELVRRLRPADFDRLDTDGRSYGEACGACAIQDGCLGLRREYLDVWGDRGVSPVGPDQTLAQLPT